MRFGVSNLPVVEFVVFAVQRQTGNQILFMFMFKLFGSNWALSTLKKIFIWFNTFILQLTGSIVVLNTDFYGNNLWSSDSFSLINMEFSSTDIFKEMSNTMECCNAALNCHLFSGDRNHLCLLSCFLLSIKFAWQSSMVDFVTFVISRIN